MNEQDHLDKIFHAKLWKDKYQVSWCELCDCAIITCPSCKHSSCSPVGCKDCDKDFLSFKDYKCEIESYLNDEEIKIYYKSLRLKKLIVESIKLGHPNIDWEKLERAQILCKNDYEMFEQEMKKGE